MKTSDAIRERRSIKAQWAPALSILLAEDEGGPRWEADALAGLPHQTCRDLELLHPPRLHAPDGVESRAVEETGSREAWMATALDRARGRWVLVADPRMAALFGRTTFVEQLLHAFASNEELGAVAIGEVEGGTATAFHQLTAEQRERATLHGVAWSRAPWDDEVPAELGLTGSVLQDLLIALQVARSVMWRSLSGPVPAVRSLAASVVSEVRA